jgi:peptidoglycan/xylan/chitin deacetylase (PgdA/CDA1 family)
MDWLALLRPTTDDDNPANWFRIIAADYHRVLTLHHVAPVINALTVPVARIDRWMGRFRRAIFGETKGIVIPVFHAILPGSLDTTDIDPSYAITRDQLGQVVDYFDREGFTPIGLPQLQAGVDPSRNYVMFTFDDGYANNLAAFDMLERAGVPALLSVNTGNTLSGEAFWWDVLYRELRAAGESTARIDLERDRLIDTPPADVRRELGRRFGEDAFRARGELDRPISVAELRSLAARPLISIANHTVDHESLAGGDRQRVEASLRRSQQQLHQLIGRTSTAIAYPYGRYDEATLASCRELSFEIGLTGRFGKLPHAAGGVGPGTSSLQLPRCVVFGDRPIEDQCENTHLDWKPSWMVRQFLHGSRRKEQASWSATP